MTEFIDADPVDNSALTSSIYGVVGPGCARSVFVSTVSPLALWDAVFRVAHELDIPEHDGPRGDHSTLAKK